MKPHCDDIDCPICMEVVAASGATEPADGHAVWEHASDFPVLDLYRPQTDGWPHKRVN